MASFFTELKRRNVYKVGTVYVVTGWLLMQAINTLMPILDLPPMVGKVALFLLALGLPVALVLAWAFELTPEGIKRSADVAPIASTTQVTGRKLDFVIIGALVLALGFFVYRSEFVRVSSTETATEAAAVEESIAVLPFANMSSDKEQEYFSDGISEELLNQLAKIHNLRVIARTSSFAFKGKEIGITEIAKQLNVAHILEGSIRKSGNKIRITAQLIRTADSSHLWSETYDRDMTDIFAVQDEISAAVVTQLKIKLLGAAPSAKVVNPQAFELFLQARVFQRLRTAQGYTQAITLAQQALALDPAYAAAWTLLSMVYGAQADNGLRPLAEALPLTRDAANKALAAEPGYALAHARLAWIAMTYDGDLAAAAQSFSRALALAPEDNDVLRHAISLLRSLDRLPAALALQEKLAARDPYSRATQSNLGSMYFYAGRWDEAIARYRQALVLSPSALGPHSKIASFLLHKGEAKAALAELVQEPEGVWRDLGMAMVWHTLGDPAKADAALAELIQKHEKGFAYNIAYVYAWRGEADQAFAWLDKAVAYQDGGLADIPIQSEFANIRKDARWLPFLRKLGKAPEQLAAIKFEVKL